MKRITSHLPTGNKQANISYVHCEVCDRDISGFETLKKSEVIAHNHNLRAHNQELAVVLEIPGPR